MIGQRLGNYRVVERIGDGGMGSVFRAVDEMLDREVAIKVLRPELARQATIVERFRQEARALARLDHPGIARLHGMERHGDELLMIMEFVRGDTLEALVRRSGRLAWPRAAELCAAVLDALDHAHDKQIVHRDIKPANIMLSHLGAVKVMDFGIARMLGKNRQTQFGHAVGTPTYMAPEQLRGEEVDRRTDLYAVGAVLFELVTGQMAFEADSDYHLMMMQLNDPPPNPSSIVPDVPAEIDGIVARAMAKGRDDRFPDAVAFARALRNVGVSRSRASERAAAPTTRLTMSPDAQVTASPDSAPGATPATRLASASGVPPATRLAAEIAASDGSVPATRLGSASGASAGLAPATRLAPDNAHQSEGAPTGGRFVNGTRTLIAALPAWQRDWRTWMSVGGVLVAAGFGARVLRDAPVGPDVLPKREAAADGSADSVRAMARRQLEESQEPGARGSGAPQPSGEDASSLIVNPPAPGGEPPAKKDPPAPSRPRERETPPTRERERSTPPPAPSKPVESPEPSKPGERGETDAEARSAIRSALGSTADQLSGQSTAAARSFLNGAVSDDWAALMEEGRISMSVEGPIDVSLDGDRASAAFAASVNVRSPFGANRRQSARFVAQLARSAGGWMVRSLRPVGALDLK